MRLIRVGGLLALVGCYSSQQTFSDTVSAEGVGLFDASTDRGDVSYDGGSPRNLFEISGRSWSNADGPSKAATREQTNTYSIDVVDGALVARGRSPQRRSGVDFSVLGPPMINTYIDAPSGDVQLDAVEGIHVATANSITGRQIYGDVDFFADSSGIDVEVFPYADGVVDITSTAGTVKVYLPWGLDYDLTIISDPDYEMELDDLGFDSLVAEAGLTVGWRGFREIQVRIDVTGGDLYIYQSN